MARWRTYGQRVKEVFVYYVGGVYRALDEKDVFLWAQAIAFKVLITIVPIIALATGILGRLLEDANAFQTVASFIRDFLPPYESDQLIEFLNKLQGASDTITILAIAGLIFSAMTLFTTLRIVVGNVFQQEWHRQRSILGGYAFDMRMAAQVGLLFLLTFGLTVLISYFNTAGLDFAEEVGLDYVWLREGWRRTFRTAGLLVPYLLSLAMFFQLFFFIPKPHPPKRSALLGAVVTALLWEVAKSTFAFYATKVGHFDRYTSVAPGEEGISRVLGETFGLIIAFVFWVYYSGVVLCIGGLIASLHEKRHRVRRLELSAETPAGAPAPPENRPFEGQPFEDQPPENRPFEDQPPEDQPPEDQPPEDQPPEDQPPEDQPPEDQPPEDQPRRKPLSPANDAETSTKQEGLTQDVSTH